jgi:hypothetical protein
MFSGNEKFRSIDITISQTEWRGFVESEKQCPRWEKSTTFQGAVAE